MLYLVRHAKAGSRSDWDDDDELRPLTNAGRRQAERIAAVIGSKKLGRLVSSPYVRCMQTLEPLGRDAGTDVVADERLAEGSSFADALALLTELPDRSVASTHGDLLPAVIDALLRRGMEIDGEPTFRKGCIWTLERRGDVIVRATATDP